MAANPNVILLTVDSLRHDAVFTDSGAVKEGLNGFRRLAEGGTSFHDAWTCVGNTPGSFKAIFSGDYLWSHEGAYEDRSYEDSRLHIAEHFREAGYPTAGFHSNPFLHERFDFGRGFDYYFTGGFEDESGSAFQFVENLVLNNDTATRLAMKVKNLVGRYTGRDIRTKGKPYVPAEVLHRKANEWLAEQSEPVFLWVHYMDVHNPWYPHEGTASEGMDERDLLRTFYSVAENSDGVSEADRETLRRAYEGSVQNFDHHLESFLDDLDSRLGDSVICLTSDHGELFGEDDWYFHGHRTFPKLLHVPLIIDAAGLSLEEQAPVGTIDIFPTLASITGSDPTPEVDGRNLFDPLPDERKLFAKGSSTIRVISAGESFSHELSDIESLSDLSEAEQEQVSRVELPGKSPSRTEADEDLEDQLEALGYK